MGVILFMDYSIQTLILASLGMNGWLGFKTVDGSVVLGGITGVGMSGVSYLVGRTIPHPTTIYGKIINIAVASGSSGIQLLN